MADNRYYLQALANALGRTLIPMYDVFMPTQGASYGAGMNAQNLANPGIAGVQEALALRNALQGAQMGGALGAMQPNASLATRGYPSSYDRNSVNLTDRGFPSSRDRSMARPMPVAHTYIPGR